MARDASSVAAAGCVKSTSDGCKSPSAIVNVRAKSGESAGSPPAKAGAPVSTRLSRHTDAKIIFVALTEQTIFRFTSFAQIPKRRRLSGVLPLRHCR